MTSKITLCEGILYFDKCKQCQRQQNDVKMNISFFMPPIEVKTGECKQFIAKKDPLTTLLDDEDGFE